MEKKTAGHTIYSRIRRVSVLGILVAMVLATGAGQALSLVQEHRMRDDTLTAAVQAVSHTLNIVGDGREEATYRYVDRTVQGLAGIWINISPLLRINSLQTDWCAAIRIWKTPNPRRSIASAGAWEDPGLWTIRMAM